MVGALFKVYACAAALAVCASQPIDGDPEACGQASSSGYCHNAKRGQAMLQISGSPSSKHRAAPAGVKTDSAPSFSKKFSKIDAKIRPLAQRARALVASAEDAKKAIGPAKTSVDGIDKLISEFMKDQSNSQDKCPAKLIESKRQLREIRSNMYDVALEINTTSHQVKDGVAEITGLEKEWDQIQATCQEDKHKCTADHDEYSTQWQTLLWELDIMKQMADPEVTIKKEDMTFHAWDQRHHPKSGAKGDKQRLAHGRDAGKGPVFGGDGKPPAWWPTLGVLQADAQELRTGKLPPTIEPVASSTEDKDSPASDKEPNAKDVKDATKMISDIKKTNDKVHECESGADPNSPLSDECKKLFQEFEESYYNAYTKVTRLISKFEILVNSTACHDKVEQSCKGKASSVQTQISKAKTTFAELTSRMISVKDHITTLSNAESLLGKYIKDLGAACGEMNSVGGNLGDIREKLKALGDAAGRLSRVNFHIPEYTGEFVTMQPKDGVFDSKVEADVQLDDEMDEACSKFAKDGVTSRAAETSEIMQQSIANMPKSNPSSVPLLGTCPHCEGDHDASNSDETHLSTHFRNCWDGKALLDGGTMRSNCGGESMKAVLCVWDIVLGSSLRHEDRS